MKSLVESSNQAQYNIAINGLEQYREVIQSADNDTRRYTGKVLDDLSKVINKVKHETGYGAAASRLNKLQQQMENGVAFAAQRLREDKGIEVIINQYNGFTDVMLPIKKEDFNEDSKNLAQKLYDAVEDVCAEYDMEEISVEGHIVLTLKGVIDKRDLAKEILDAAPPEYGGDPAKSILYLRIAPNFSFQYDKDKVIGVPIQPSPVKKDLSREEAIEWFTKGKRAADLAKMFPDTPKMTLAGWMSAWTKGAYERSK
jgi:hypothetical protein